jgi:hypothetical protein
MEKAIELAETISQVLGEGVYTESEREVRRSTILLTAGIIQQDIEHGLITTDEDGRYWKPEFVDTYGGLIDEELDESSIAPTSYEINKFYD